MARELFPIELSANDIIHGWVIVSAIASTVAVAFAVSWARARRRVRDLESYLLQRDAAALAPTPVDGVARRVEEIAGQVERLAEGQEFLSRLVADRRVDVPRAMSEPPRLTTPH